MTLSESYEGERPFRFDPPDSLLVIAPTEWEAATTAGEPTAGEPAAGEPAAGEPAAGEPAAASCGRLLAATDPGPDAVLLVRIGQTPGGLSGFQDGSGVDRSTAVTVLSTDDDPGTTVSMERSAAVTGESGTPARSKVVAGPGDLTGLGHNIAEVVANWDDGTRGHLCFSSIAGLLEYFEVSEAFRFLHVLSEQIAAVEGVAHFHATRRNVDERTLVTLEGLFDRVVEFDDGDWIATNGQ